ncbi:protein kinase domain-containing protein [Leptolyngbya sp. AN03gr2]|uniref:protein kinase domain-containing protein n=1 Tax=unclassified Leptolyngbya TaxID=2650499 RepID=UPI003D31147C
MSFLQRFQFNAPKSLLGGRYQIIQELGAGGFGQTFLATDLHLPGQPHCVVKQLKPQSTHPSSLQVAARLFDTEAQVLYQLGHHDQIPRLLAHFQEGSEFYLVQEWIDGTPLSEELIAGQRWTEAQVIFMLQSLLDVLAFVHQQNVIHRDIKPSNLMRRRSDHKIVLIDFGAVKQVSTALSHPHAAPTQTIGIGTPGYMPIEQIAGTPRFSSDIYAIGVVAIEALTGICPRRMNQDPNTGKLQWRDDVPHLDSAIATVLEQMICPDFRDRYATAVEALTAIQAISAGITPPPVLFPLSPPPAQSPPTEVTIAVNPVPNSAPLARRKLPFFAPSQSTALAPDPARNTSLPQINTLKQLVPIRWRESLARVPHHRVLPPAIGLTVLAFVGWTATRPPQTQPITQSNAPAVSPSPNPAEQVAQLLTQAEQQQTAKQYQSALDTYEKVIALDSKSAKAHWGRCYNLNYLQRSQDAIVACDAALALRSDYPEALWSKGYALDQQQRYEQALPLYERAIALKPDFAEAWSNKATLLLRLNRLEESIAAFDKAIALKPELAEAWNNRGAALWSLGRMDEAVSSINKAIQLRPDYADALSLRQQIDRKLGRSSAQARQKQSPQKRSKANRTVSNDDEGDDD